MTGGLAKTTYDDLVNEFEALLDQLILAGEIPLEPTRVFRRQFILSHATLADSSNWR